MRTVISNVTQGYLSSDDHQLCNQVSVLCCLCDGLRRAQPAHAQLSFCVSGCNNSSTSHLRPSSPHPPTSPATVSWHPPPPHPLPLQLPRRLPHALPFSLWRAAGPRCWKRVGRSHTTPCWSSLGHFCLGSSSHRRRAQQSDALLWWVPFSWLSAKPRKLN